MGNTDTKVASSYNITWAVFDIINIVIAILEEKFVTDLKKGSWFSLFFKIIYFDPNGADLVILG